MGAPTGIFVYGILRPNGLSCGVDRTDLLLSPASTSTDAILPHWELYRHNFLCRVIPTSRRGLSVVGNYLEYEDLPATLTKMDKLEQFTGDPNRSLYTRQDLTIELLPDQSTRIAWVYTTPPRAVSVIMEMASFPGGLRQRILSGDAMLEFPYKWAEWSRRNP